MGALIQLREYRSEREGWEPMAHGEVDFTVFDCGSGLAEVRMVTGSAAKDTLEVHAVQVCEVTLDALIEKATRVRDEMRRRRTA